MRKLSRNFFFNNIIIGKLKKAFTLAEILITLAIIGLVAALTIPSLITKINEKVMENQKKVFEAKLIKGLNLTKAAGDLNNTYSSTYDFLENGLSKHLKIAKICDTENIGSCVPYDKINYLTVNNTQNDLKIADIDDVRMLSLKESKGFKDLASFVMGDGTVVIASYNLNCIVDSGELDKEISSCFAGIYDLNGSRKPNKMGKDILNINNARINSSILAVLGGVKIISAAQNYGGISTSKYCDTSDSDSNNWTVKPEYSEFITKCCTNCQDTGDYWAAAAVACNEMEGKLPSYQQFTNITNDLYSAGDFRANEVIPSPANDAAASRVYLWVDSGGSTTLISRAWNFSKTKSAYVTGARSRLTGNAPVLAICVIK